MCETTVLGAAIAAGIGVGVWSSRLDNIPHSTGVTIFNPSIDHDSKQRDIVTNNYYLNY